jgi:dipeptide transport system ATP-binding protein
VTGATPPPAPVLEAVGLCKDYPLPGGWFEPKRRVRALDGVGFSLGRGRTLAVVGESGCGKTTLARQLALVERPTAGSIRIDGALVDPAQVVPAALQRRIQMVFQNPYSSLNPRRTVARILSEPLDVAGELPVSARRERVLELLDRVGLSAEQAGRYPHMFSGGQRQRIAIARAMALDPAVIVADEPVSALDVSIQAQILNLFLDLQERFGTAYVFVSHNLSVVEVLSHEVMVMYLGRPVEVAPTRRLFAAPVHPYTRALLATSPRLGPGMRSQPVAIRGELPSPLSAPGGCAFHPRCPQASARCRDERPELRDVDGTRVACHFA